MFFSGSVAASAARRVGALLLREAMTVRAEIDLASDDRLFPAQDFMPNGSFGNLIALPLQGACRRRGTSVFLVPSTLRPFDDQWALLSTLGRSSPEAIEAMAAFRGRLVQYVGCVLRPIEGKVRVEVHDYVDVRVPVLARMHAKRLTVYASLGFDVSGRR